MMNQDNHRTVPPDKVPAEQIIAEDIAKISEGMKRLNRGRMTNHAIDILLYHACGRSISMKSIRKVLNNLAELDKTYLKPNPKKEIGQ